MLRHQGSEAKGGGGGREERFTSLSGLICRAQAGGCPRACVLPNPRCACLKPGHAAPRRVRGSLRETAASFWMFLTALFTWAAPGVRARSPPHTWTPASQAQKLGSHLEQTASSNLVARILHTGFSMHLRFQPLFLDSLQFRTSLSVSVYKHSRSPARFGNPLWFIWRPPSSPLHHCSLFHIPGFGQWFHRQPFYPSLHIPQPVLIVMIYVVSSLASYPLPSGDDPYFLADTLSPPEFCS